VAHKVHIPTPLRTYTNQLDIVEVEGATVGEVLANLATSYGDLRRHLYTDEGKLRSFVNVYLNDDDIRYLQKEETPVRDGDSLSIIPSVAGGVDTLTAAPPTELPALTSEEIQRYNRHLIMPEVGMDGQRKLKAGSVLCIGAGGLGSPVALYLAAAGVGRIGLVDFDVVDHSNLQRQIIHGTPDVGRPKLHSAKDKILAINPHVRVDLHETQLSSANALDLFKPYDVIVDGTDNFPTRYLVNDACVLLGKPNAYGSIFRFEGQASVFAVKGGPCYRCLYPEPPPPGLVPSCAEGGVLGVLPGLVGLVQATEAIKLMLGVGEPLVGRFLIYDALGMRFRELKLRRDPECPVCGDNPTVKELIDYEQFCGLRPATPAAAAAPAASASAVPEILPEEVKAKLDRGDDFVILDVREPHEVQICRIDGSIVIPLGQLPGRVQELDRDRELVVHCRSGARSAQAVGLLQRHGFDKAVNLKGGILAWIDKVDPSQPKY
jgi:molybdopterin/thiamine biosynthesis adenylyltransferase/rhodanese-related sulfurtransferase/molybdopterin converting factor small subunit